MMNEHGLDFCFMRVQKTSLIVRLSMDHIEGGAICIPITR